MKAAVEHVFTGLTSTPGAYDPDKTTLGKLIGQYSLGSDPEDKFAGPHPIAVGRPMEQQVATAEAMWMTHVVQWSPTIDWVFLASNATAANARRLTMYEYDRPSASMTYLGHVTMTPPAGTNHTVRGLRVVKRTHTSGTVAVSGTAVTGTGTTWATDRVAGGARIGFGSTDPTAIGTWYELTPASAPTNTGITLTTSAGTIAGGTAYVIEELWAVFSTTNNTATSGGLFVTKGLTRAAFVAGTAVAAAVSTDNVRAVFWLKDASTVTNTVAGGLAIEDPTSTTSQMVWVINGATTTPTLYKYNILAALTVASGASTNAWVLTTGTTTTVGNVSQTNNGRIATLAHGPGSGVACYYFVTATRVYRAPLSGLTSGAAGWAVDSMVETPPGAGVTYANSANFSSLEIAGSVDRMLILTSGTLSARPSLTTYKTDASPFERGFMSDTRQNDQATASAETTQWPNTASLGFQAWVEDGMAYFTRGSTATNLNQLYAIPFGADWDFASPTDGRLITPRLAVPGGSKLLRVLVNSDRYVGGPSLGVPTEPYRVYARTDSAGIADNSGSWTLLGDAGDLTALATTGWVQLMFEFRILGPTMVPARIFGVCVLYESAGDLPSEFEWTYEDFNTSDGSVGFGQVALFGGSVPALEVNYYRSDTNALVLTQASSGSTNGVFEYWNGSAWTAGLSTDTLGTRRRFRPTAGLPTGVAVYATLTVV